MIIEIEESGKNKRHQMFTVPEDIPEKLPFPPGAAHCCPL